MTLGKMIRSIPYSVTESALLKHYPDQADSLRAYRFLYDLLRNTEEKPNENDCVVIIELCQPDEDLSDCKPYFSVCGLIDGDTYALDFTEFNEWLGYYIPDKLLLTMPHPDIVARCLWEMTFHGFTSEEVREAAKVFTDAHEDESVPLDDPKRLN